MKRIYKRVNFGLLLIVGLFALPMACSSPKFELVDGYIYKQHPQTEDPDRWELVWEDRFDSLQTQFWTPIDLYRSPRFTNRMPQLLEDQNAWREITNLWASYMSAENPETVTFDTGVLHLKALKNRDTTGWDNRPYHTGGLWSQKKLAFQYGRLEIRAQLDPAYGAWPALWLIPEKAIYSDQHNGEIDIMERLNHDAFVYQTIHSHWNLNLKLDNIKRYDTISFDPKKFNTFWVSWKKDQITFGVNDQTNFTYQKIPGAGTFQWPFDQPFFIILSQQLEGWPGKVTQPEELPIDMKIDWIRLYQ
ncbi:MAG: glycoside hydrolase family 16 protein [Flavobacteriaceae bacterium]